MSASTLPATQSALPALPVRSRFRRLLSTGWTLLVGGILCQYALLSIVAVGWCYRLMRRVALREWWRLSPSESKGDSFLAFARDDTRALACARRPNWILAPFELRVQHLHRREGRSLQSHLRRITRTAIGSLLANAKLGVQAILNTWVVTLPGCVLWLFGWYSGWDNSFNKGYEQFWVGVTTGWIGIALFITAMLYVPIAQARQAATGDWRTFYQFRVIRTLVTRRWLGCAVLAGLYAALAVPITVARVLPMFFDKMFPQTLDMPDAELVQFLHNYGFWCAMLGFALFVVLRVVAARIYARSLADTVRDDLLAVRDLHAIERHFLKRLQLDTPAERADHHVIVRALGWTGSRAVRIVGATATVLLWLAFVVQIFAAEFLNYHPIVGWLNQPLVQLPVSSYIPRHLFP